MKKLLMLILSISMATVALTSCGLFEQAETSSPTSVSTESQSSSGSNEEEAKKEYTITFQQAGQTDKTVTVEEGDTLTDIPTPVQTEGYTTVWKATDLAKLTNISGNVTVVAEKTANKYTITFEAGEGVTFPATKEVTYDANVTLSNPERAGYTFGGWFIKGTQTQVLSGAWKIANNVTLTAAWTENAPETVTVTFVYSANQSVVKTVEKGAALTDIPAFPSDEGYEYSWSVTDFSNITENMTVTLNATAKTFVITYDANGGEITEGAATQTVTYGANYELAYPTVTREGYNFTTWTIEEGKQLPAGSWNLLSGVTFYAQWEEVIPDTPVDPETITITFVDHTGNVMKTVTIEVGETLTTADIPALPTQDGYTFAWDKALDGEFSEETTIKVVATAKQYTITYDANGGELTGKATQTVTYDAAYTLEYPTVSKENYNLVEWKPVGMETLPLEKWTLAQDVTIQAQWKEKDKVAVTFVYADGTSEESDAFYVGTTLTDIPDPTAKGAVTGYTIDENWYTDDKGQTVASFENIQNSMTVYAKKTAKTYTVKLNADGGSGAPAEFNVKFDAKITLTAPTKVGYNFIGWYNGDTLIAKDAEITWKYDNITELTAKWEAKTYTVTLNANGGTLSETTLEIKYGATYTLPTPTKAGNTFKGWKQGDTLVELSGTWTITAAGENVQLDASWEKDEDGDWTQNY